MTISVLEVYNDTLRDQLAENGAAGRLEIKQAREGGIHIPDLTEIEVSAATLTLCRPNNGLTQPKALRAGL